MIRYVANIKNGKYHVFWCPYIRRVKEENRKYFEHEEDLLDEGIYEPCKYCSQFSTFFELFEEKAKEKGPIPLGRIG